VLREGGLRGATADGGFPQGHVRLESRLEANIPFGIFEGQSSILDLYLGIFPRKNIDLTLSLKRYRMVCMMDFPFSARSRWHEDRRQ
jgi:hypothetical protein